MQDPSHFELSRRDVMLVAAASTAVSAVPFRAEADTSSSAEQPVLEKSPST
ncbi:hypothetical protein [Dongia sedimenti]|uniref:Secreted protein n=1 Tax=Dongia sedimenti TaxID=3064282 RepID=A0ABU0YVN1_9PROT|nr:hypothetical protein [Rhodospirillaceae bacterium R-7]